MSQHGTFASIIEHNLMSRAPYLTNLVFWKNPGLIRDTFYFFLKKSIFFLKKEFFIYGAEEMV